jgi:hypothetical protein
MLHHDPAKPVGRGCKRSSTSYLELPYYSAPAGLNDAAGAFKLVAGTAELRTVSTCHLRLIIARLCASCCPAVPVRPARDAEQCIGAFFPPLATGHGVFAYGARRARQGQWLCNTPAAKPSLCGLRHWCKSCALSGEPEHMHALFGERFHIQRERTLTIHCNDVWTVSIL